MCFVKNIALQDAGSMASGSKAGTSASSQGVLFNRLTRSLIKTWIFRLHISTRINFSDWLQFSFEK